MGASLDSESRDTMLSIMITVTIVAVSFIGIVHCITKPYFQRELQKEEAQQQQQQQQQQEEEEEEKEEELICDVSYCNFNSCSCYLDGKIVLGSLVSLVLMSLLTIVLTIPIVMEDSGEEEVASRSVISSSSSVGGGGGDANINFCEMDYEHSVYIAEPANVMSSMASYVPLALMGMFGPPSKEYRGHGRFVLLYLSLFSIGLGSTALHATLTAQAQAGDELPMLWFTASASYCAISVVLRYVSTTNTFSTRCLEYTMTSFAVLATALYVQGRDDFIVFSILFASFVFTIVFSMMFIVIQIDWIQPLMTNVLTVFQQQQQQQQQKQTDLPSLSSVSKKFTSDSSSSLSTSTSTSSTTNTTTTTTTAAAAAATTTTTTTKTTSRSFVSSSPGGPSSSSSSPSSAASSSSSSSSSQQDHHQQQQHQLQKQQQLFTTTARCIALQIMHDMAMTLALVATYAALIGIWTWTAEMLFCNNIVNNYYDHSINTTTTTTTTTTTMEALQFFVWTRVLHTVWHLTTAYVAWCLIQGLLVCHGIQEGWGIPIIKWYLVPYLAFSTTTTSNNKNNKNNNLKKTIIH